jgi:hypothetical protein
MLAAKCVFNKDALFKELHSLSSDLRRYNQNRAWFVRVTAWKQNATSLVYNLLSPFLLQFITFHDVDRFTKPRIFFSDTYKNVGQDSSAGTATRHGLEGPGIES